MSPEAVKLAIVAGIFVGYCQWIVKRFGRQLSISDSAYTLQENLGWWGNSIFFWWGVLWLLIMFSIEVNWLYNIAIMVEGFLFGAWAFRRERMTKRVHMYSSVGGILLGILSVGMYWTWWYVLGAGVVIGLTALVVKKNTIWWVEVVAFFSIVLPLIYLKR